MDHQEEWEVKKSEVLQQLNALNAVQLTEICGVVDVVVPPAKAGKRAPIFSLIMRYLNSEEVEDRTLE